MVLPKFFYRWWEPMNAIYHWVKVDGVMILLGGGGDTWPLFCVIKIVWTFWTKRQWGTKNWNLPLGSRSGYSHPDSWLDTQPALGLVFTAGFVAGTRACIRGQRSGLYSRPNEPPSWNLHDLIFFLAFECFRCFPAFSSTFIMVSSTALRYKGTAPHCRFEIEKCNLNHISFDIHSMYTTELIH